MRLDELRVLACIRCGATNRPLRKIQWRASDGAMQSPLWPNARACDHCLARHRPQDLARDAEQTVAGAVPARRPGRGTCAHCGEPVLMDVRTGGYFMWCQSCEAERQKLMGGA